MIVPAVPPFYWPRFARAYADSAARAGAGGRVLPRPPDRVFAADEQAFYLAFARTHPALYEAMFTLGVDLTFAGSDTPAPLHAGFVELREALAPLAGDRDAETFTEVAWSGLHGLATLSQAGRLRPALYDQRLAMLVDQLGTVRT